MSIYPEGFSDDIWNDFFNKKSREIKHFGLRI